MITIEKIGNTHFNLLQNNSTIFSGSLNDYLLSKDIDNRSISIKSLDTPTNGAGRSENVYIQVLTQLFTGDHIEIWVENNTSFTSIIVTDLNVIIRR